MNTKKEYISPELKVVEFKVEKGFAMSQGTQTLGNFDRTSGINRENYSVNGNPFHVSFGSFGGNKEDWD